MKFREQLKSCKELLVEMLKSLESMRLSPLFHKFLPVPSSLAEPSPNQIFGTIGNAMGLIVSAAVLSATLSIFDATPYLMRERYPRWISFKLRDSIHHKGYPHAERQPTRSSNKSLKDLGWRIVSLT